MSIDNIRVPPDSTGKRILSHRIVELSYLSGSIDFNLGDIVVGLTSDTTGTVNKISGTTASGTITLNSANESSSYLVGEELQVNGITKAFASFSIEGFAQKVILAGANNPLNEQNVDIKGSAFVRFADGDPLFDAFGSIRFTEPSTVASYNYVYDDLDGDNCNEIQTTITGTGSKTHDSDSSSVVLQVGTTIGSKVSRTTNRYNIYIPGISHLIEHSIVCGDTGKDGVVRRWGYFDDNDGLYFQLNENTLEVVQRSSVTGVVTEIIISQEDFNKDVVDGTNSNHNPSGFNLDVSKANLYWIDYQWLGVGQARFGVYTNLGERIILHIFGNPNSFTLPYMSTGTLPLRWEIENIDTSPSISEMRIICSAVQTDSYVIESVANKFVSASETITNKTISTTEIPVISIRPSLLYGTKITRNPILLCDSTTYTTQPIILRLRKNGTLTDSNFQNVSLFSEVDTSATAIASGDLICSILVNAGSTSIHLDKYFSYLSNYIMLAADGTQANWYSITAERLTASDANMALVLNWKEVNI